MTEKTIHIDGVDPRELFGAQDTYLELIREQYPALRIVARGSKIKVMAEERLIEQFVKRFEQFEAYYDKYGHVYGGNVGRRATDARRRCDCLWQ